MFILIYLISFSCTPVMREYARPIPAPDHVVIVFMENHTYDQVVSDTSADFIQELLFSGFTAQFANSYAMGHPSQPNYLHLFSGSNQGVENNEHPPIFFTTNNLAANLIEAGKTFISYAEDLPYAGFDGEYYEHYVRKHNPVTNWVGTGKNQVDSLLNQPFTSFPSDFDSLPTVSYVIPNLINDMHDAPIGTGDDWLRNYFSDYIEYTKTHNSIFILTFDEGSYDENGNHVLTFITGQQVLPGIYYDFIDHHILLRTVEDMYNINHSGNASFVQPVSNCWK